MAKELARQERELTMPHAGRPALPAIPGEWLAVQMAFSVLLVATLMLRAGLVVPQNTALAVVAALMIALATTRYQSRRGISLAQRRRRDFTEYLLLFFGTGLLGVVASYPAAALSVGYEDTALARFDRALHFDWVVWYGAVARYPSLQILGTVAYAAIYVSPVIVLGYFAWTQRRCEARAFLVTFWVAGLLTLALFAAYPAEGPLAFLWHGPIPYMPASALYAEQLIPALRDHQMTDIDMGALRGLVSAPSFHTVSAVLYVAAAWPIARLRWPIALINAAMLLAIPIEGTHYLADMVAGALVAAVAIVTVKAALYVLVRRQDRLADRGVLTAAG